MDAYIDTTLRLVIELENFTESLKQRSLPEAAISEALGKRAGTLGTLLKETKALKDVWQKENQGLQHGNKKMEEERNELRAKADSMKQANKVYAEQTKTLQDEKSKVEETREQLRNDLMTLRLAQERQAREIDDLRKEKLEADGERNELCTKVDTLKLAQEQQAHELIELRDLRQKAEGERDETRTKLDTSKLAQEQQAHEIIELRHLQQKAEGERDEIRTELDTSKLVRGRQTQELNDLLERKQEAEEDRDRCRDDAELLKRAKETWATEKVHLETRVEDLQRQLKDATRDKVNLEAAVGDLQQKTENETATLLTSTQERLQDVRRTLQEHAQQMSGLEAGRFAQAVKDGMHESIRSQEFHGAIAKALPRQFSEEFHSMFNTDAGTMMEELRNFLKDELAVDNPASVISQLKAAHEERLGELMDDLGRFLRTQLAQNAQVPARPSLQLGIPPSWAPPKPIPSPDTSPDKSAAWPPAKPYAANAYNIRPAPARRSTEEDLLDLAGASNDYQDTRQGSQESQGLYDEGFDAESRERRRASKRPRVGPRTVNIGRIGDLASIDAAALDESTKAQLRSKATATIRKKNAQRNSGAPQICFWTQAVDKKSAKVWEDTEGPCPSCAAFDPPRQCLFFVSDEEVVVL